MTAQKFRCLALARSGASESTHGGHPDFRVNGQVFASLGSPDAWGMVKLNLEEQEGFIDAAPTVFRPCVGVWGERGYTNIRLVSATPALARQALEVAVQNVGRKGTRKSEHRCPEATRPFVLPSASDLTDH